jgi:hypothetical protein
MLLQETIMAFDKIASKFLKRGANLIFIQRGNRSLFSHFTLSILGAGRYAEHKRSDVFLVFAHEQILNFRSAPQREQQQTSGDGIERAAMADFRDPEASPDQRHDIVGGHAFCLIDEQDAIRSGI